MTFRGSIPKSPPPVKEPKRLRAKSKSTADRDARYALERVEFLADHPLCEARLDGCTFVATEVHHQGGRAASVFWRKSWWLPVCGTPCHKWITEHPAEAYERGLSYHRNGVET